MITFLGEEKAGQNWAGFLEYGSKHPLVIAMQNSGISRYTALKIFNDKELKKHLIIDGKSKELIGFDKPKLLSEFKINTIEYDEIFMIS